MELSTGLTLAGLVFTGGLGLALTKVILSLRRVVSTNEVHIVQSGKSTTSYGTATENGNSYYEWPSWMPVIGVTKITLPISNFDIDLKDYEAYDKGRLPFIVDVKAFFRIKDSNVAAQRVSSFQELLDQLKALTQGAVRTVLATSDIEEIMQGRSKFGDEFTKEVQENLNNWGVETVRNVELMDIRDGRNTQVIHNIMEKKKSFIEMESRTEVAKNQKMAEVAEIEARREVDLQKQEASQTVGLRTVEAERQVALQQQSKIQALKEQEKTTKEKEMAVLQIESVRKAEIDQQVQLVKAEQNKQTTIITAKAQKETAILTAEGQLEIKRREAEAITLEGTAKADAEKALQLAPVQAQITLAKEIGENASYQKYLITIRQIEATQAVGMEQAKALSAADIKVISNTGSPTTGLNSVMDLFSSQGGTQVGAMLEGLAQTETGQAVINKVVGSVAKDSSKKLLNGAAPRQ